VEIAVKHTKWTYYNEYDPNAAEWLRQLILSGEIPEGTVDERSIVDVAKDPDSIKSFRQHHFFAGIGVWAYSLRQARWDDDRPIWTASLPCQPFSSAGSQKGFEDDRHLWPHFFKLVQELKPGICLGEQVSSKPAYEWFDVVAGDLEAEGYAAAAIDMAGGCVGAYHKRQRFFWAAILDDPDSKRLQEFSQSEPDEPQQLGSELPSDFSELADSSSNQRRSKSGREVFTESKTSSGVNSLGNTTSDRFPRHGQTGTAQKRWEQEPRIGGELPDGSERPSDFSPLGHPNGGKPILSIPRISSGGDDQAERQRATEDRNSTPAIWQNTHWIECNDGKYRAADRDIYPLSGVVGMDRGRIRRELERGLAELYGSEIDAATIKRVAGGIEASRNFGAIKSSISSMASGIAGGLGYGGDSSVQSVNDTQECRIMRLKGYGNAIVAPLARIFIESLMTVI
jgi:DNA (cytosine-5)-methyltransferase 1